MMESDKKRLICTKDRSYDVLETESSINFATKVNSLIDDSRVIIHTGNFHDVIKETCITTIRQRRPILLLFYKDDDEFSKKFVLLLKSEKTAHFINENFYFLGWDIQLDYQSALKFSLEAQGLFNAIELLESKTTALFIIGAVDDVPTVQFCYRGKIDEKNLLKNLQSALDTFHKQNNNEIQTLQLVKSTSHENDIGPEEYQQMMAQLLGDRDYDCLDYNQHDLLKMKIGYALFGPPSKETDSANGILAKYDTKQENKIEKLYQIIRQKSNEFAEYKDRVLISVIYNCTEPLPAEKLKRAKKFDDYNAKTDICPIPVFVLRKCTDCDNPCRIFIDDTCRVYSSFTNYLRHNKLPECHMILPKNGRYEFDSEDKVILEKHLSPACDLDVKILKGADIASTATGLFSTGIIIAAAIPAITVAPALLMTGIVGGIGVGAYSIGRSVYSLVDRKKHSQTMSFADSEARGAYLNIVAGSLGFVGGGANAVVSQLVLQGVNIGKGASVVVNTINIANLAANGINVGNCTYEVLNKWLRDNETPSAFTIFQMTTSILFFGNALYNFKTVSTIVEETQASFLQEYQDSLRSNRHRKTFNKLTKETIRQQGGNIAKGQAEIIKTVRNIKNRDEVFAILTRNNKAMNENGVKFSAEGGQILLNGQPVDMSQWATLSKNDVGSFLNSLPPPKQPTPVEKVNITKQIENIFTNISREDILKLCAFIPKILCQFDDFVRECILHALNFLLDYIDKRVLANLVRMFPDLKLYAKLLDIIVDFIGNHAKQLQQDYVMWQQTNNEKYYNTVFKYINEADFKTTDKVLEFFKLALKTLFINRRLTPIACAKLCEYFKAWFIKEYCDNIEANEQIVMVRENSATRKTKKLSCNICNGNYYSPENPNK